MAHAATIRAGWVGGHNGHCMNERADALARLAAKSVSELMAIPVARLPRLQRIDKPSKTTSGGYNVWDSLAIFPKNMAFEGATLD